MNDNTVIGVGLDSGSPQAGRLFSPLQLQLNDLFEQHCAKRYAPDLEQIVIRARVSGAIADFAFEGIEPPRKTRRPKGLSVELGIPQARWKDQPIEDVKSYLAANLKEAIEACSVKLGLNDDLRADTDRVLQEFLSS